MLTCQLIFIWWFSHRKQFIPWRGIKLCESTREKIKLHSSTVGSQPIYWKVIKVYLLPISVVINALIIILFPSSHLIISSCTMLRIWHNLRINLRAWPRMGAGSVNIAMEPTSVAIFWLSRASASWCYTLSTPLFGALFQSRGLNPGRATLQSAALAIRPQYDAPAYMDSLTPDYFDFKLVPVHAAVLLWRPRPWRQSGQSLTCGVADRSNGCELYRYSCP